MKKNIIYSILGIISIILSSCREEPKQSNDFPINKLPQISCDYDDDRLFNSPADSPECFIINSVRDIANLPKGTLADVLETEYTSIDYAKLTLIVITSVIYSKPTNGENEWDWARANFTFSRDYKLDIKYYDCSVMPTTEYTQKRKMQFSFTTTKIPSDTKITITESLATSRASADTQNQ